MAFLRLIYYRYYYNARYYMDIIGIIMAAGKSSVDVALYTLIPVMVVMLIIMRFLEHKGVLAVFVNFMSPLLKPFGLTGMAVFALIQLNLVSFAAPLAALAIMEKQGTSDRHLAAALAMLFTMGQGNVFYPLIPWGLNWSAALVISVLGGLVASAITYHLTGRKLSISRNRDYESDEVNKVKNAGIIQIINSAGVDAIKLALGSVPMLILSLTVVGLLQSAGVINTIVHLSSPLLSYFDISEVYIMPALTKILAGGTAYYGVISELLKHGAISSQQINASAGFMIQTLDLPGVGILLGISGKFVRLFRFALPGAVLGILIRGVIHAMMF